MAGLKKHPEPLVFGLDIGTRSIVGTVGYKENNQFYVIAQATKYHETRSMIDGQIHDIQKVADGIIEVKNSLEEQLDGRKLKEVCIAAAGRVLKTSVGHGDFEYTENTVVNQEYIHSLEMLGVERAYEQVVAENGTEVKYYCVGYTVIKYFLNGFEILNLEGHKANSIGADVLATFLPEEVVDGLYAAVELAGLEVENLTLEPIAAMNVAIPQEYRLLNIGLLDVGAGTSDICITKDGSIIAYGMIPSAGDEITETLIKKYLVDFNTAEKIKMIGNRKSLTYKDIMGISHKITPDEVLSTVHSVVDEITKSVADKIIELNGGKSINALFVVGGGGKLPGFTELLAKHLKLPAERVALRGSEVMQQIHIQIENVKKDPLLVTPIGICLNFYEQKNNFIYINVNGDRIKLYDNDKLTVFDAAVGYGIPNEKIFPQRGQDITFKINEKSRIVRGSQGEAAVIRVNDKEAGMNTAIFANDQIQIQESTKGEDAHFVLSSLPELKKTMTFMVNDAPVICPGYALVNGEIQTEFYEVKDGDDIVISNYYTVSELLRFMDVSVGGKILVNNEPADMDTRIYDNFKVSWSDGPVFADLEESSKEEMDAAIRHDEPAEDVPELSNENMQLNKIFEERNGSAKTIHIRVNKKAVTLSGKGAYVFVDIFDVYPFDLKNVQGTELVMTINGEAASHFSAVNDGDQIEIYWKKD